MFFLGIDAGGTKTAYALGDETSTLASSVSGSVKLGNCTETEARHALAAGIAEVCPGAGIQADQISAAVVGLSGASIPAIRDFVSRELAALLPRAKTAIYGDHVIAHRAAFPDGNGVLVVAGTGSICHGRNASGREVRVGGHGPVISDEGSGTWIGREALRRLMLSADTGVSTPLLDRIAAEVASGDRSELVRKANACELRFSELAPLVLHAAESGDDLSAEVLADAGLELANLATLTASSLYSSSDAVAFSFSGSIAVYPVVQEAAQARLKQRFIGAQIVEAHLRPEEGALLLVRSLMKS